MSITLEQVSKHYDGAAVVNDVSVSIGEGELFVLLGPSGSGKSTLLRAIAGLTPIDHGRVTLHGRDVTHITAREREVGFVFQNYALFRHMSVADNIEFALRARRVRAAERRRRCTELLELVSLEGYGHRLPLELSGGQQQRVALARALAHEPRVLLLDEPFGALDAKIRDELRRAVRDIQRAVGITTVLVTHDQDEAFKMADHIGVMDRGRLQEAGEPRALYARPRTRFVATFLGAANLLLGHHEEAGVRVGRSVFRLDTPRAGLHAGAEATVVIRPEDVVLAPSGTDLFADRIGPGTVEEIEFVGALERVRVTVGATQHLVNALQPRADRFSLDVSRNARESDTAPLAIGDRVDVGAKRVHVLPTQINSLRLIAPSERDAAALAGSHLVRALAENMHITPMEHAIGGTVPRAGLLIAALDRPRGLAAAVAALEQGARQVLLVRDRERRIDRMLMYIQASRAARERALSVAGSVLRHLPIEATLLVPTGRRPRSGASYRELLDLRSAALRMHGVDVRTATFHGNVATELRAQLRSADSGALLLIGLTSVASGHRLMGELSALLDGHPQAAAVLLVCSRSQGERVSAMAWPHSRAAAGAL